MSTLAIILLAALLILVAVLFLEFRNLSKAGKSSPDQTVQLFTMLKNDLDASIRSVSDASRANSDTIASTLQLVTNTLSKGMEDNRAGTNAQVVQLTNQVSELTSLMGKQVENLRGSVEQRLSSFEGQLGGQLSEANKLFSSLKQDFGELKEASVNMMEIGKQINQLQNILSSPKLRGNLGETLLEELIKQVIPQGFYEFQYGFRDGSKVDAIIRTSEKIIPIDSKFPKDEFQRYVDAENDADKKLALNRFMAVLKGQIDDIASKYIKPAEGTFDFAIMFIPSESMYYELLMQDTDESGVYRHAMNKHVIPASPNSFYAYIQAIAIGLKGMQIEKNAERVRNQLAQLENALEKFGEQFDTLGTHLRNAQNKYGESHEALGRFRDRLQGIANIDEEPPRIE
ncbi:MAG TPA: DNA recombination protein RmuC [Candidatus Kryptonia bacterium]